MRQRIWKGCLEEAGGDTQKALRRLEQNVEGSEWLLRLGNPNIAFKLARQAPINFEKGGKSSEGAFVTEEMWAQKGGFLLF